MIGRGNNRQTLFLQDGDFRKFLEILGDSGKSNPLRIAHYCLMPNHVHLLLFSELRETLSRYLQRVNLSYSWWYRKRYNFHGHVWQGRFKSLPIEKDSYLMECGRYIERNPVNAKLVADPNDYRWSSYRFYVAGVKDSLIVPDPGYLGLGANETERCHRYREYVTASRPYEFPAPEKLIPTFQGW
ncbi:MAG: transposase [Candidatus Omnitrophica bacterium]|nr:transposase [Candidatus Omnitrophota bacterium]